MGKSVSSIKEIGGLRVHPIANIMPMMSVSELDALALDIQEQGLREPIWLFKKEGVDYLLDGRNRSLACQRVGVIPEYRYYEGDENSLLGFVISLNIQRRSLSGGQKACLAIEILPMIEEQTKKNLSEKISALRSGGEIAEEKTRSTDVAGTIMGVSGRYVAQAKKLYSENKELFNQVKSGEVILTKAMKMLKEIPEVCEPVHKLEVESEVVAEECELVHKPEVESEVIAEDCEPVHKPIEALSKLESKKVSEYIEEFGVTEDKAIAFIIKRRKPKAAAKPKTSFSNRIEFKVDESEKELLMQQAKAMNMSLSEYIRSLIKKG